MTDFASNSPPGQTHPSGDLTIPWPKQGATAAHFHERHQSFLRRGAAGPVRLLFLGDSLTEQWDSVPTLWQKHFGAHAPANFGIGGDGVQHVLWRIEQGELDNLDPHTIVLLIGTNNTRDSTGAQIAHGIYRVLQLIRARSATKRMLLMAIFPRGRGINADGSPEDGVARMRVIRDANARIAGFADDRWVRFLDIGKHFFAADGQIQTALMPDRLHLGPAGYRVWAEALGPELPAPA